MELLAGSLAYTGGGGEAVPREPLRQEGVDEDVVVV